MQLLTYVNADGQCRAGVKLNDSIFDAEMLTGKPSCASIYSMLEEWDAFEPLVNDRLKQSADLRIKPVEVTGFAPP